MMRSKILVGLGALMPVALASFAPTNFFTPYSASLRLPQAPKKSPFRVGVSLEYGDTDDAYNWDGKKKNILQIHDDTQSSLSMLLNPTDAIETTAFLDLCKLLRDGGAVDDGSVRGHLRFTGDFDQFEAIPHVRYVLPGRLLSGHLALSAHLPVQHANVDNIKIEDLTAGTLRADLVTKENLTSVLTQKVKALGNLDLGSWSKTDVGDLLIMLDWSKDFAQNKSALQNVEFHTFIGLLCPTGLEKDENKAFSMAFGNDGAWALPLGLGLDLDFKYHIALGVEAQCEVIFDETRTQRLKTDLAQTEFLLLNKGQAKKDYGLTWNINLYLQGYHFWRGLSLKAAYEYIKHDRDDLTSKTDAFNTAIINSANSLKEWNTQNVIFMMNYDFFKECKKCCVKPQISLFYKLNCDGKRVIASDTFGGQLALNF